MSKTVQCVVCCLDVEFIYNKEEGFNRCPKCGPLKLKDGHPYCEVCGKSTNPAYKHHHLVLRCWSCGGRMAREGNDEAR